MKVILRHLQQFFTVDNPFLIVTFLALIIFSRFSISFFNDTHQVRAPEPSFFGGASVGHDLFFATTDQAYRLLEGLPMQFEVGYGYAFTVLTAWFIQVFHSLGICNPGEPLSCQFLFYKLIVVISLLGLFFLPFLLIKEKATQVTALIFLIAFLLGVPGSMGIESGNLDILLSVMYGCMLFLHKTSLVNKKHYFYPIVLGFIAGIMLQTKLFVLPIVFIFLLCSTMPLFFILSFIVTVGLVSILPGLYHVPIDPLYAVKAAEFLSTIPDFSSGIVYGNNSTRAMVGGILFAIPALQKNQLIRDMLLNIGGGLLFVLILVLPILSLLSGVYKKIVKISLTERLQYAFFILLNCYAVTVVILWPEVSLAYRFFYLIPLIYILLDASQNTFSKHTLGVAVSALLIRSMFLWHARFLHIFLLIFFYTFLLTSISIWLQSPKALSRSKKESVR